MIIVRDFSSSNVLTAHICLPKIYFEGGVSECQTLLFFIPGHAMEQGPGSKDGT